MSFFLFTWWFSVGLAVFSLLAMTSLIIVRARRLSRGRTDDIRRQQLQTMVFELMDEPDLLKELKIHLRPRDRQLLLQLFDDLLQQIHGKHADRFAELMNVLELKEECLRRVNDRFWWARAEACAVLGAFDDPIVKFALYQAVIDPVVDVRVEAARSLVRLGAVKSVARLVKNLTPEEGLPSLPVMVLFRSLGRSVVPELIALLEDEAKPAAKILAIDALGHAGDASLLNLYNDSMQTVRVAVMQSLALLGDPRALPAVLLAMTDTDWEVRVQAAICAGQISCHEMIPLLEKLLEDDQWWVRYRAAEALYKIGGEGVAVLRSAMAAGDEDARAMAEGLLLEKGSLA